MQMTKRQSKKNKRGVVLLLVIGMVVFLSLIGLGLLGLGSGARMQAARATAGISALTAADAGLTHAVRLMKEKLAEENPDWDELPSMTDVYLPGSYASFSFDITREPAGSSFQIISIGKSGIAEKMVRCKLMVQSLLFGIGVMQSINLKAGAKLGTIPPGGDFTLRTNSSSSSEGQIVINSGVVVPGDVVVGPGGDPESIIVLKSGSVIEGQTYVAAEELMFPQVFPPDDLVNRGTNIEVKVNETKTVGDESGHYRSGIYTSARVKNSGRLEITEPNVVLYITGDFRMDQSSELIIRKGTSLKLYLGGDFRAGQDTKIINENITPGSTDPDEIAEAAKSLKIYGTDSCTLITLNNSSDFYGMIYARNADLQIHNSGNLYGAFVGEKITMNNSSGFYYYVPALANISLNDETAYLKEYWWEE